MTTTIILSIIIFVLVGMLIRLYGTQKSNNEELKNYIAENTAKSMMLTSLESQIEESNKISDRLSVLAQENATLKEHARNLASQLNEARNTIQALTPLNTENATLREQIRIINEEKVRLQQESEAQFKLLANKIFEDKSKQFKELNENRLSESLVPLREKISKFEKALH